MRKLFYILIFSGLSLSLSASDPVTTVLVARSAKDRASGLIRMGKGLAEVPLQVGECLRLPLGLVEMVFSPLPGIEFKSGLENTGKGIVAPFKLCRAVLELPVEVAGGVDELAF